MCKRKVIQWSDIKATKVHGLLQNFPQCGMRYTHDAGVSLIIVHPRVKHDVAMLHNKIKAALSYEGVRRVLVAVIPAEVVAAAGVA